MDAFIKHLKTINNHHKVVLKFWWSLGFTEFTNLEAQVMKTDWAIKYMEKL